MTGEQLQALIKKNLLGSVCGFLGLVLLVVIYFRSDALPSAETKLTENMALGQRYATNLSHGVQLQEHYDAMVAANKEIDARLLHVGELTQNYQYFYKLETDTGVKLTVSQTTQPASIAKGVKKNALTPIGFSVSAQGNYSTIIEFLRRLENGAHFSRILVSTLSASGVAGVDGAPPRALTLTVNVELLGVP